MTTMYNPMMTCGHAANGVCAAKDGQKFDPPIPSCVICGCLEQAEEPSLEGRKATCTYCKAERSSTDREKLAFFEYRGPGSYEANNKCYRCGYYKAAHDKDDWKARVKCPGFEPMPQGRDTDSYYCGCRGWD